MRASIRKGEAVHVPPNPAEHITDWLMDIGPTIPTGMGPEPISWEAINAWCDRIGIELDAWEARTIRRLSRVFIAQQNEARKPSCPAPYSEVAESPEQVDDRVTAQFKAMFDAFAQRGDAG